MNILWMAPYPGKFNAQTHPAPWVKVLASELRRYSDINLTILNYSSKLSNSMEQYKEDHIRFVCLKTPRFAFDISTLYQIKFRILKNYLNHHGNSYDLLHIHGSENQFECVASDSNLPTLLSVQGIISECNKLIPEKLSLKFFQWKLTGFYEKRHLQKIPNFSCRTHWDKAIIRKLSPKSTIYHNWEIIRPEFWQELPSRNSNKILFLGGTNSMKGFREMLQAFNLIKKTGSKLKLIILGDTSTKLLKHYIKRNQLTNIHSSDLDIRGFQNSDGILQAIKESFCLVHPSYIDNSPNSICESQVFGLPVIATDVGGVSSLISDEETGLLVKLDPQMIAIRVLELHNNVLLQKKLSDQSKIIARERHDKHKILAQTYSIYSDIIQRTNSL